MYVPVIININLKNKTKISFYLQIRYKNNEIPVNINTKIYLLLKSLIYVLKPFLVDIYKIL